MLIYDRLLSKESTKQHVIYCLAQIMKMKKLPQGWDDEL
jgi:hypothetical protein